MIRAITVFLTIVILSFLPIAVQASESEVHPHKQEWSFNGLFGQYDKPALRRGYQIYSQVCAACHSMHLLYYRNLTALGFSENQVKSIAAEYMVTDGPNDEGEMFERSALPSDPFVAPYPNKKATMYANNGAYPPDMSLLAKARHGGADYIYAILTGYEGAPQGKTVLPGQHWNKYMPGHVIAMAAPLYDGKVEYEDGSPETLDQYARDIAQFLTWTSEPHMVVRKQTGTKAFLFILVFTFVMYRVKKRLWADVH